MALRRTKRRSGGQAIIEFALLLPLLLLVLVGITEFGRALMTVNVLNQAAREGARVAAIGYDNAAVTERIMEVLSAARISPTDGGIVIDYPDPSDTNKKVTVTVNSEFAFLGGDILPVDPTISLTGRAVMRYEASLRLVAKD